MCIRTCGATWVYIFVVRVLHMVSEQHVTVPGVRCGRASVVWVLAPAANATRRATLPPGTHEVASRFGLRGAVSKRATRYCAYYI